LNFRRRKKKSPATRPQKKGKNSNDLGERGSYTAESSPKGTPGHDLPADPDFAAKGSSGKKIPCTPLYEREKLVALSCTEEDRACSASEKRNPLS